MTETRNEQANAALKQQYLESARALSQRPEVFRGPLVTQLLCEMLALRCRAEAEVFQEAYGDSRGRQYWSALFSEPIPVRALAYKLSIFLPVNAEQLDDARIVILRAFRDAAAAGERWFIGDISPLLAVEDGQPEFAGLFNLSVHPRAAVEWLLDKPRRRHLVPAPVRTFLQSIGAPVIAERPLAEVEAERFVTGYVDNERAAGRRPNLTRLEAAAREAGIHGGREYRSTALHRLIDIRRGRPSKT